MRAALLVLLALATPATGIGVHDAGVRDLAGTATDLVERRVLLDLWDAGQPKRAFALQLAPDGDELPGVEARWRPVHGAEGRWHPLGQARLVASGERAAQDRGWDGLYELALRLRLPNVPAARLAVLVVEDAPGRDAVALTTRLQVATLRLEGAAEATSEGPRLRATLDGPKAPLAVEAHAGARQVALEPTGGHWEGAPPTGADRVRLVARFPDGGLLEGPWLDVPAAPARASPGPAPAGPEPEPAPAAAAQAREAPAARGAEGREEPASDAPKGAPTHAGAQPRRALPDGPISLALAAVTLAALLGAPRSPPGFKCRARIEGSVGPCTRPRCASR